MKRPQRVPPVFPRQTVQQAFVALLEQQLFSLGRWEDSARTGVDVEGVHQLRVALRRMRSVLRIFRPALASELTRPWSEDMRYLAGQLGPARDLDVFLDQSLTAVAGKLPLAGADQLRRLAEVRRSGAYDAVRVLLDSERYSDFKRGLGEWLRRAGWQRGSLTDQQRAALAGNVGDFARRMLKKQRKRVLRQGRATDENKPEELHRLRIECKKLRYAAECFAPLYAGMAEFIDHLKGLQDLLGVMNDVSVTQHLLDDLLQGADDPDALRYGAGLIGWRCCQYEQLRHSFGLRWREFRRADKPW